MFSSLVLLFINLTQASSPSVEEFAFSKRWQRYLQLEDRQSKLLGDRFFLSKSHGSLDELKESLKKLDKNQKTSTDYYHCLFPARYLILSEVFSISSDLNLCRNFNDFKKGIDIDEVYFVFVSSYPNNPASMFGHNFLRFSRKDKAELSKTKEILGYSASFQAKTNPSDNSFLYTFKGLFGGYQSYLEIKPHYINLGVYNNGESRDLWETKLNLTNKEKRLLIAYMWEMSLSGVMDYYFFDENCSTHILDLLSFIRPNVVLDIREELFVVPQVAYREVHHKWGDKKESYREAITRKIKFKYQRLSLDEKKQLRYAIKGNLKSQKGRVLDVAVDYWKYQNYREKNQLGKSDKKVMFETFLKRSQKVYDEKYQTQTPKLEKPSLGHKMSLVSFGGNGQGIRSRFRYGFHDINDHDLGFDGKSYFSFLDISKTSNVIEVTPLKILSLEDFDQLFKKLSWSFQATHTKMKSIRSYNQVLIGAGVSKIQNDWKIFILPTLELEEQLGLRVLAHFGFKKIWSQNIFTTIQAFQESVSDIDHYQIKLGYLEKQSEWSLFIQKDRFDSSVNGSYALYF